MNKPRICEVVGVEVGERFNVYGNCLDWHVDEKGHVVSDDDKGCLDEVGYLAINHPDRIIRKPRWTEQEVELAKLLYDFRISENVVIGRTKENILWWRDGDSAEGLLSDKLFPSLNCGDFVKLSDIIGGAE